MDEYCSEAVSVTPRRPEAPASSLPPLPWQAVLRGARGPALPHPFCAPRYRSARPRSSRASPSHRTRGRREARSRKTSRTYGSCAKATRHSPPSCEAALSSSTAGWSWSSARKKRQFPQSLFGREASHGLEVRVLAYDSVTRQSSVGDNAPFTLERTARSTSQKLPLPQSIGA